MALRAKKAGRGVDDTPLADDTAASGASGVAFNDDDRDVEESRGLLRAAPGSPSKGGGGAASGATATAGGSVPTPQATRQAVKSWWGGLDRRGKFKAVLKGLAVLGWIKVCSLDATGVIGEVTLMLMFLFSLMYVCHRLANVLARRIATLVPPVMIGKDSVAADGKPGSHLRVASLLIILVSSSLMRSWVAPGVVAIPFSGICGGAVFLIIFELLPPATLWLMLLMGWLTLSYMWLLPEFCTHVANPLGRCYLFWFWHPFPLAAFCITWWLRVYGTDKGAGASGASAASSGGLGSTAASAPAEGCVRRHVRGWTRRGGVCEHLTRALIGFPYVFGIIFFCVYWCLVSGNYFWQVEGEQFTKGGIMSHVPPAYSLGSQVIRDPEDIEGVPQSEYPYFLKPNVCSRSSMGASPIDNIEQAREYMRIRAVEQPERTTLKQRFHEGCCEAVIVYFRVPYWNTGMIKTIWIKKKAVHTNSWLDMRKLILSNLGTTDSAANYLMHTRENQKVEIRDDIAQSPALMAKMDEIAAEIPGCTAARFDIKFTSTEALAKAQDFWVLEMDTSPWGDRREKDRQSDDDPEYYAGWRNSVRQTRTMTLHIYTGAMNIVMGYALDPLALIGRIPLLVERTMQCEYDGSMAPATPGLV